MKTESWMTMSDGVDVYVNKWEPDNKKPQAIVQLSHGMVEHIGRYDEFATYLMNQRIIVYGNDHRGHGKTGENQGQLGYLADQDGFNRTTEDLYEISKQIKSEHPHLPLFLFSHSMGSFLARKYIQTYSTAINGVIFSGTGYFDPLTTQTAKGIARLLPARDQSEFMNFLAFGSYNKRITNQITPFDWLTRDQAAVEKYMADPHTGYIPTARFFYDLMDGLGDIHSRKKNQAIRPDLPMFFISGDADPVGHYAKGIWKTAHHYDRLGIENIKVMLFADGRHELLSELNKKEVFEVILDWINRSI